MALRWMEGFDDLATTTTDLLTKLEGRWDNWAMNSNVAVQAGTRTGFGKELLSSSASPGLNVCNFKVHIPFAAGDTIIVGMALKLNNLTQSTGSGETGRTLFSLWNQAGTYHGQLYWINGGTLGWSRDVNGYNDAPIWTTTNVKLAEGAWTYVEAKIVLNNSTGSVSIRTDMGTEETGTNLNTSNATSLLDVAEISFFGGVTNHGMVEDCSIDDIYVADDTGTVNNDWLGSVEIVTVLPTADGTVSQWTPSTGVDHYALLDEIPPDDADYVSTGTSGHRDLFQKGAVSGSDTIYGIQTGVRVRNSGVSAATVETVVKGTAESTDVHGCDNSFAMRWAVFETDPDTSTFFTDATLNAVEIGMEAT